MAVDIQTVIATATNQANQLVQFAENEIANSASRLVQIYGDKIDLSSLDVNPGLPGTFVPATPPTLVQSTIDTSGSPSALAGLVDIPDPRDGVAVPTALSATAPTLTLPSRPGEVAPFTTGAPIIVTDVVFPDAPSALSAPMFAAPVITPRDAPTAPTVVVPTFSATTPVDTTVAPTNLDSQFLARYREQAPAMTSALDGLFDAALAKFNPLYASQLSALEGKLSTYIAGGTAMTDATENMIFERSKDKMLGEARRARDVAYTESAKRGFTMPDGQLYSAAQRARQSGFDNLARAAADVAIERAKMEQQNIQFALTLSDKLRSTMLMAAISYHQNMIQINGQALAAAQQIVQAIVETYNIAARVYGLKLDAFRAEAAVYEARLRAALAAIDLYQAQIKALEALTQVDRVKVDVYRGQIDALNSVAALYRTQIDAVVAKASLQKLKIDVFGSQVQAYAASVQANTAQWQGYSAAIGGEEAKVRIYAEQVQAKRTETEAFRANVDAKNVQIQAMAAKNEGLIRAYTAQWSAYSAKMQAEGARVTALTDFQRNLISAYSVANQAAVASAQANVEFYRTTAQIAIERGKAKTNGLIETAKIRVSAADGIARTASAASQTYGQMAGAALSGMNTLVSSNQA